MFSSKTGIAAGATIATVGAFAAVGMGAANPGMAGKTVAQAPVIQTEVQVVRRTIHLRPKPKPHAAPTAGSGTTYAAANPATPTNNYSPRSAAPARTSAPTVSTHSSGGHSAGSESDSGDDNSGHSEKEGNND
ncbi:MAG: hypothetical protein WCI34_02320 [Actinomycetes bacterium]